jgi:hypothetical protein
MVYPSLQRRVHLDVLRVSRGYSCNVNILVYAYSFDAVWETTARQLAKGEWKFRVASNIHFILASLASNSCKASRNLKTLATITGLQL